MPRVFRLCNAKHAVRAELLDGEGARLYGGRWNRKGTPLVYAASHVSLAALEALVHSAVLPRGLVLIAYDVPDVLAADAWPIASLPADWTDYPAPASTQDLGTRWAEGGSNVALKVPSVVVPLETNWLLNPRHPAIRKVKPVVIGPLSFDACLR